MVATRKRRLSPCAAAATAVEGEQAVAASRKPPKRAAPSLSADELAFRSLLASCALSHALPAYRDAIDIIVDGADASALRLKTDARLPPAARTSDLPLRLFYQQRRGGSGSDSGSGSGSRSDSGCGAAASPRELAVAVADALQSALPGPRVAAGAASSVFVAAVSAAPPAQVAPGLPPDRLIVRLREAATASEPRSPPPSPDEQALRWIYRDDALGVVDKPSGVLSVDGTDPQLGLSIHRRVRALFPDARMVHRLDLETSGLLVVALTRAAAQHLSQQFRDRAVRKTYLARVVGRVAWPEPRRRLRLPMERDPSRRLLQRVVTDRDVPDDSALWSVTDMRAVECGDESTLMELRPETGKTHQLRVHMLHVGHPILGDSLYDAERVRVLAPRLYLHAAGLRFTHPDTGEALAFESPCPF